MGRRPVGSLGYDYAAPLVILQAVALFVLFAKMKFKSRLVNWSAKSAFAIFLIHMHPTIKYVGYLSYAESLYHYSVLKHIGLLFMLITVVFVGSILIDRIRIFVSDFCYKAIVRCFKHIPPSYIQVENYFISKTNIFNQRYNEK